MSDEMLDRELATAFAGWARDRMYRSDSESRLISWAQGRIATLTRERDEARTALALCRETLDLIETERRYPESPELEPTRRLCEQHGYGAVMAAAASIWREVDPVGAKTVGPCAYLVQKALTATEKKS